MIAVRRGFSLLIQSSRTPIRLTARTPAPVHNIGHFKLFLIAIQGSFEGDVFVRLAAAGKGSGLRSASVKQGEPSPTMCAFESGPISIVTTNEAELTDETLPAHFPTSALGVVNDPSMVCGNSITASSTGARNSGWRFILYRMFNS